MQHSSTVRHHLILIATASLLFFVNLGATRLWDIDEPRNAGCAAEMIRVNDWVTPVFNGELRVHKPVLLYWLMMSAYEMFGENEFAARFWSALLAVGTVVMTYHIGRRLFGSRAGFWSAMILATTIMFNVAAHAATPDSVLIFFTTATTLTYVLGTFKSPEPASDDSDLSYRPALRTMDHYFPQSWPIVVVMYGLMGVAVLAKGPVGLVLPTAVIGMFLLIKRLPGRDGADDIGDATGNGGPKRIGRSVVNMLRPFEPRHFLRTCWYMRPLTAIMMTVLIAGPWYVWVGLRTDSQWIVGFLWEHNFGRAMQAMEGHNGPIIYYPVALLFGTFPWSVFVIPAMIELVRRLRRFDAWTDGLQFAACWAGVYVALFSLAQTKLPSYIEPMYPAAAMIYACYMVHMARRSELAARFWSTAALWTYAVVGVGIIVGLGIVAWHLLDNREWWIGLLGLVPLIAGIIGLALLRRGRSGQMLVVFGVSAVLFCAGLFQWGAVVVSQYQTAPELAAAVLSHTESDRPTVITCECFEPSWTFYCRTTMRHFRKNQADQVLEILDQPDTFLITTREILDEVFQPRCGDSIQVVGSAPYFLKPKTLVVVRTVKDNSEESMRDSPGGGP